MIGSNVPIRGGLLNCFRYGDEWGCECIQIYVSPSRRWQVPDLSQEEATAFKEIWRRSSVKQVIAHVPLLVNVASPSKNIWNKSINRLITEISRCRKLGISLVVLHPGSYRWSSRQKGVSRIVRALDIIGPEIGNSPVEILLETMAGQGKMIGSSFEEMAYILERVENPKLDPELALKIVRRAISYRNHLYRRQKMEQLRKS